MRLLHTDSLQFEEFYGNQIPQYAILSHRWASAAEEVSYAEFRAETKRLTSGYAKILSFCKMASMRGFDYCWVDTCCIVRITDIIKPLGCGEAMQVKS